jgi:hypothetical protein
MVRSEEGRSDGIGRERSGKRQIRREEDDERMKIIIKI